MRPALIALFALVVPPAAMIWWFAPILTCPHLFDCQYGMAPEQQAAQTRSRREACGLPELYGPGTLRALPGLLSPSFLWP